MSADKNRGELLVAFEAYKAQVAKSMIGGGEGNRVRQILDRLSLSDFEAGWQASRAALLVELPSRVGYENRYDEIEMSSLDPDHDKNSDEAFALVRAIEVIEAIEAAGARVKP